jgi:hypothetical protein
MSFGLKNAGVTY